MPGGDLEFSSSGGVDPGFLDESGIPRYSYDPVIESEQSETERGDPEVESGMLLREVTPRLRVVWEVTPVVLPADRERVGSFLVFQDCPQSKCNNLV
jgi:hypothetical protein